MKQATPLRKRGTSAIVALSASVGFALGWHVSPVETEVRYQTVVEHVDVPVEVREPAETPYADSLVDWRELERETDCLWVILQDEFGWDITMERVTAAALWTHELGGACAVIEGGQR